LLRGQVRDSLPVNLTLSNNASATPCPSVPSNQAATNGLLLFKAESKIKGRPEIKIVTTGCGYRSVLKNYSATN
jgi:hypothetical protein